MATLDRIIQMQREGLSDTDVFAKLQKEGVSPKEINDSLNQARIKSAVSEEDSVQTMDQNSQGEMQASIMQDSQMNQNPQQSYPQPQQNFQAPAMQEYPEQQNYQEYYPQTPQAYEEQQGSYYPQSASQDTDTIAEIAEQVLSEKLSEFNKKADKMSSFIEITEEKLIDLADRIEKVENSMEKLKQAIIGRIGEFGESSANVHKDLENLHNTMQKLVNPLVDNYNELKKANSKK